MTDSDESPLGGAGVEVRALHELAELRQVLALFDSIWRPGAAGGSLITVEMLRALSHTGNYLAGAVDPTGALLGASVGFFTVATSAGSGLHSHITGVTSAARRQGVGLALKLHQRDWALARGLTEITWTYDPLVRRNAHFNLAKLGARPREYLVDFYGEISDSINAGQGSDRLFVVWDLSTPPAVADRAPAAAVPAGTAAVPAGAVPALTVSATGAPTVSWPESPAPAVLVQVPADIEALRGADPALARAWRLAVREVLGALLASGGRVTGFVDGQYVVEGASGR